jgi:hypothetical protein
MHTIDQWRKINKVIDFPKSNENFSTGNQEKNINKNEYSKEQKTAYFNRANEERAKKIINEISKNVCLRVSKELKNNYQLQNLPWRDRDRSIDRFSTNFEKLINSKCNKIIQAAKCPPKILSKLKDLDEQKKNQRKILAENLSSGRKRLRELNKQIIDREQRLEHIRTIIIHENTMYPQVTPPSITPTPEATGLPVTSGIYFIWENNVIEYVGQSTNLNARLRLYSHNRIQETDMISFVEIPKHMLTWAECFYIGILHPTRNGGTPARSTRHKMED